ncbi:C40 family peptidase [Effusibacillus lacus]|uniref:Hydrolase n=1 Tax=Effusibacillus lacus TaxID=1348429 RepID=A0A292YI39_9BACL|nr:NlpC/P60 family protein [Effusibacillus lacus]TCS74640.1 peptidoglycan endopeptidase LytE [Effusibacillus lacus]GAX88511.1 hydrolase [Effusibacillus lacus]
MNASLKILTIAGTVSALTFLSSSAEAAGSTSSQPDYNVHIQVDDQLVQFPDAQPFIDEHQRTQVPVRFISEKLGYKVDWVEEGEEIKVTLKNNDMEVVLRTGDDRAKVNGKTVRLDTDAVLLQNRTYVPLRFVSETAGMKVNWDSNTATALIITGKQGNTPIAPVLASRSGFQTKQTAAVSSVVDIAKKYVGVPYAWGGTSPKGFDCSGFVNYVFAQNGVQLPRTAAEIYKLGTPVTELQPGDLVFHTTYAPGASHVGIYVGDNQFISATSSSGVKIVPLNNPYWGPRYIGAKRL